MKNFIEMIVEAKGATAKQSHLAEATSKFDLKKAYSAYNTLYFDGKLPTDFPIAWYKSKKMGGEVAVKVLKIRSTHDVKVVGIKHLKISNLYARSDEAFSLILLHEMVHVWVAHQGVHEVKQHGPVFNSKLRELNTKFKLSIPESEVLDKSDLADEFTQDLKKHFVVMFIHKDNRASVALYSEATAKKNATQIKADFDALDAKDYIPYKLIVAGMVPTNLHHTKKVSRTTKGIARNLGSFVEPHVFAEISGHLKNNKGDLLKAVQGR
tara:strand:+ start:3934 stop:4734 length:801 start_codon:yes stop_codon:yes gene_type:complete